MKLHAGIFAALLGLVFFSTSAHANDRYAICAKDLENRTMYHAVASNASGLDLNTTSHTTAYDTTQNYIVVSWVNGNFSIIHMQPPISVPSFFPARGIDQDGHMWEVSLYSTQTCP